MYAVWAATAFLLLLPFYVVSYRLYTAVGRAEMLVYAVLERPREDASRRVVERIVAETRLATGYLAAIAHSAQRVARVAENMSTAVGERFLRA